MFFLTERYKISSCRLYLFNTIFSFRDSRRETYFQKKKRKVLFVPIPVRSILVGFDDLLHFDSPFYDAVNSRFVESRLHNYRLRYRDSLARPWRLITSHRSDPALTLLAMLSISRLLIISAAAHLARRNRLVQRLRCAHLRPFNTAGVWRYNIKVDDYRYSYSLRNEVSTVADTVQIWNRAFADQGFIKRNEMTDVEIKLL